MKKFLVNRYFIIGVSIIIVIALTGGAFYFGYKKGTEKPQTVIIRGVANLEEGNIEAVDFSLFGMFGGLLKTNTSERIKLITRTWFMARYRDYSAL